MALDAVLIAGPTASGKSALALALAESLNGVVINADSMQVYKDLHVITACPSEEEVSRAPHRLYEYLDGDEVCSAARWAEDAEREIKAAQAQGMLPIIVGGTGLYFRALLDGLAEMPDVPDEVRNTVRAELLEKGPEALHKVLSECDEETAQRLAPADSQRICRALEIFRATGKPISYFQKNTEPGILHKARELGRVATYVLDWPRDQLYARCDQRFDLMLDGGAIEEVDQLLSRNLPADRPVMKALGVPELIAYRLGDMSLDEARAQAQMQTRRFAKRQMTWFRNQTGDWGRISAPDMAIEQQKIIELLKQLLG